MRTLLTLALVIALGTCAFPRAAAGEAASLKEIEGAVGRAAAADRFSGVVLVAKDGKPVLERAYGFADRERNVLHHARTKFNLGSMNKMFTAVAVAQLAERGKLSFDDTLGKLLPDYPNKEAAAKVTVHHLLTHTSGLGDYLGSEKYRARRAQMRTLAEVLATFADEPLRFQPGTRCAYSNAGFVVLGRSVEQLSGRSYYDYVREHVFKPAGMKETDSYERGQNVPDLAVGYTRAGESGRPSPQNPRRPNTPLLGLKGTSAGGGYSTAGDMLRFALALQRHKLLSAKYTELVTTGKVDAPMGKYAYGFGDHGRGSLRSFGHNGGAPGVAAHFEVFPQLGYTVVILGNYDPPSIMPVVEQVIGLLTGRRLDNS